jgi:hypothetical protein
MLAQPKAFAHVATNPAFQIESIAAFLGQPEAGPPTAEVSAPSVPQFLTGQTLAASPQLSHFIPEAFQTLRGRFDLPFRVDAKPRELAFPRSPRRAFAHVHFQPQMLAHPHDAGSPFPIVSLPAED